LFFLKRDFLSPIEGKQEEWGKYARSQDYGKEKDLVYLAIDKV